MVLGNILEFRNLKKKKGKELVLLKSKQSEFYNIVIKIFSFSYDKKFKFRNLNLETRESENCSVSPLRRL